MSSIINRLLLIIALMGTLGVLLETSAVHDSLNFVLAPQKRECFFEDFEMNTPAHTVEAFVQSGGNLDIMLTVHGPLDLEDVRSVSVK